MYYYTRLPCAAQAARSAGFALELIKRCFFARFLSGIFNCGLETALETMMMRAVAGLLNLVD